ncbi:MAG: hypothetical protein J6B07_06720 [Opitutales bacterium]|nr:hypothetical protein [Opitutales bacterium]
MKTTFRLIKKNPISFVVATIISLVVIVVSSVGMLWMPYVIYTNALSKNIIAKASNTAPSISKYKANIFTGECVFENLVVFNSQEFDTSHYQDEGKTVKTIQKNEMLEIKKMTVYINPLSIFNSKPEIKGVEIEIEAINAIRITPHIFNILKLITELSDEIMSTDNKINKFVFKLRKKPENQNNITYLDFSSSRDIINLQRNEEFSFSKIGEQDVKQTLNELADACNISMPFLSRAIKTYTQE